MPPGYYPGYSFAQRHTVGLPVAQTVCLKCVLSTAFARAGFLAVPHTADFHIMLILRQPSAGEPDIVSGGIICISLRL